MKGWYYVVVDRRIVRNAQWFSNDEYWIGLQNSSYPGKIAILINEQRS